MNIFWTARLVLVVFAAVFNCAIGIAQTKESDPAFERAEHLRHGVNASLWFAQSPGNYSKERLQTFTTPDDIALIARMGFDHVRLSIDAEPLVQWQHSKDPGNDFVVELDRVVKVMLENHLSVIIDIHPESRYKATLFKGTASVQQFRSLWASLAEHYASTDPEHVFFEIMNEPEQDDPYRWQGIESVVAPAIRRAAPEHTIIAAGARWSGLEDLLILEPLALTNVIYTFHDYEPFPFTHQGATWTSPEVQPLHAIPYPSNPDVIAPALGQEPDLSGEFFLAQYGLGRWDAARVEGTIEFAARWSQQHHAPVYCGEFGVLRDYSPPRMRAQWLHDMRVALEKNHIGWAMWDYQANFGVVTKKDGKAIPDVDVLNALGLNAQGR